MEALRQSVKAEGGRKRTGTPQVQVKKGKKRIEGQREMLLPIPGKKDKETAAKSTARSSGRHKKADNEGIAVTYPASALVGLFGQLHSSLNGGSLPHGGMDELTPPALPPDADTPLDPAPLA